MAMIRTLTYERAVFQVGRLSPADQSLLAEKIQNFLMGSGKNDVGFVAEILAVKSVSELAAASQRERADLKFLRAGNLTVDDIYDGFIGDIARGTCNILYPVMKTVQPAPARSEDLILAC